MSKASGTPLTEAARVLDSHPAALRKTINRFQIVERDGRRRLIPNEILALFRRTKAASGYLYPRWVRTRADLLTAAAQIPASEMTDFARHQGEDVGRIHHCADARRSHHGPTVGYLRHDGGGDG